VSGTGSKEQPHPCCSPTVTGCILHTSRTIDPGPAKGDRVMSDQREVTVRTLSVAAQDRQSCSRVSPRCPSAASPAKCLDHRSERHGLGQRDIEWAGSRHERVLPRSGQKDKSYYVGVFMKMGTKDRWFTEGLRSRCCKSPGGVVEQGDHLRASDGAQVSNSRRKRQPDDETALLSPASDV